MQNRPSSLLVTGASGLVGSLIVAVLLQREAGQIVVPLRQKHNPDTFRAAISEELEALGCVPSKAMLGRLVVLPLPNEEERLVAELTPMLRSYRVEEIIHSAGCLSYANAQKLFAGNQRLTSQFLELGRALDIRRFVYISTAYSCGFVEGPILEQLHAEPASDPNDYTPSKRATEHIVAKSGFPYLIVRPSIVIGNSENGRYTGKPYGIYQLWNGLCRLLCDEYRSLLYAVAPRVPANLVHSDAMQAGFYAAFKKLPDNSIIHLVSRDDLAPTAEDVWQGWMESCGHPSEVRYYSNLLALPWDELDEPQRLLFDLATPNIGISVRHWQFQHEHLDGLREEGLVFRDVTVESTRTCLNRFLAGNAKALSFIQRTRDLAVTPRVTRIA